MSGEASGGRQPTTVNVADLDIAQLADVKRQLDQASVIQMSRSFIWIDGTMTDRRLHTGARASYEFICSTKAGPSQV